MNENTANCEGPNTPEQALEVLRSPQGYHEFVRTLFNRSGDLSKDFTHAVLGLCTEVDEILAARDGVNAVEEAGDLMFYTVALDQVLSDWQPGFKHSLDSASLEATYTQLGLHTRNLPELVDLLRNQLMDMAKRWVGYGKQPVANPDTIMMMATSLVDAAFRLSVMRGEADESTIIVANVAKLLDRYKGAKFNAELAVNRDTDSERKVLEGCVSGA